MSHWNHRVIRKHRDGSFPETWFEIRECFYNGDEKIPHSWTEDPARGYGENIEDLKETLEWMKQACDKPVLEEFEGKLREVG